MGIGTLYRRFPSRAALFEAVYADQAERLLTPPAEGADPRERLEHWLRRFVRFLLGKHALAQELAYDSELVRGIRAQTYASVEPLVAEAQAAGAVRTDIDADDVLRLLAGVALAQYPRDGQRDRVVSVCLDGLRL